jgi:ATP-dependent Clp protease ATP-binding subunit ClpB
VDFKNTVVIMTSNIGSEFLVGKNGEVDEGAKREVLQSLHDHFRPEFLNRVDDTLVFGSLSREHIGKIVNIQLARLGRLLAERKLSLSLSERAKALLAEVGYDPQFGARPLKRAIQRLLQDPLAQKLLAGDFVENDAIRADAGPDGTLIFSKA